MLFIDIDKYFINYFAHFRKTRAHEERIDQGDRYCFKNQTFKQENGLY